MSALDEADRYLRESAITRAIDRATIALAAAWSGSRTVEAISAALPPASEWAERYRSIGAALAVAVLVHVSLTLMQGPRPGWFWIVIPAMAAFCAAVLLVASSAAKR